MKELVNDYLELTDKANQSNLDLQMMTTLEDVFIEYQEYKDSIEETTVIIPLTKFQQIKLNLLRYIKTFLNKFITKERYV